MVEVKYLEEIDLLPGTTFKGYVSLSKVLFPKKSLEEINGGEFGIVVLDVEKVIEGKVPSPFGSFANSSLNESVQFSASITAKGLIPPLKYGTAYYFEGLYEKDRKYGYSCKIVRLSTLCEFSTREEQEIFLNAAIGEKRTKLLFDACENPMELLNNGDVEGLIKIDGIGEHTARKLIEKYNNRIDSSKAIVELQDMGLTQNAIERLVTKFHSADTAVQRVKENPYDLIGEVDGMGWARADAIALNYGIHPTSETRIMGFVKSYLKGKANTDGHSWVDLDVLVNEIFSIAPEITNETLRGYLNKNICSDTSSTNLLYYDAPTRRIGLRYYRELEEEIAKQLFRIMSGKIEGFSDEEVEKAIKFTEEEKSICYTDEQRTAIKNCIQNPVSILSGSAGCVDKDTEFFDGVNWKKISDYKDGDKVLQYLPSGVASLAKPLDYIVKDEEEFFSIDDPDVSMTLSREHNVYFEKRGRIYHLPMQEVVKLHEKSFKGFSGAFITTFVSPYTTSRITEEKARLLGILFGMGGGYDVEHQTVCMPLEAIRDVRSSKVITEAELRLLPPYFALRSDAGQCFAYNGDIMADILALKQPTIRVALAFAEEFNRVLRKKKAVLFKDEETANIVQICLAYGQTRAVVSKNEEGAVVLEIKNDDRAKICRTFARDFEKAKITTIPASDGKKYCFTMPFKTWVMRKNGKIFVTGNTGKTTSVAPIANLLYAKGKKIAQCALSGKASSNLSEVTRTEGSTIHRLLKYDSFTGTFNRNEQHPLEVDAVILDELSLVGGEIFLDLLKAIPTGARLIMLGDPNQLEAIGLANLLKDLVYSRVVPTTSLVKIHRQAARSGIITESLRVSAKEQIIPLSAIDEVRGELRDLHIVTYSDSIQSEEKLLGEFDRLINKGVDYRDILIVVPLRSRGSIGALNLNVAIQEKVNPLPTKWDKTIKTSEGTYTLRPNDRVIITRNLYGVAMNRKEEGVDVFNGNTGFITSFDDKGIWVNLTQQGEVCIPYYECSSIELGYCITCHKIQGSSSPYVIVGIDNTAYTLLSKEWIYTALTRAKKYCSLVGQISAIRQSSKTSRVMTKQTWLQEIIVELNRREKSGKESVL